jgi:hypothetical protein
MVRKDPLQVLYVFLLLVEVQELQIAQLVGMVDQVVEVLVEEQVETLEVQAILHL